MAKIFITSVVLCVFGSVLAETLFSYKDFKTKTAECAVETGMASSNDMDRALKCSYSCLMKKYNIMDNNGKLIKETAIFLAHEILGGNAAEIIKMIGICSEIEVSKDHCDAAMEYITCVRLQEAPEVVDNEIDL